MCRQISTLSQPRSLVCTDKTTSGLFSVVWTPQHTGKAQMMSSWSGFVMSEAQNALEGMREARQFWELGFCWVRPIWKIVDLISSWAEVYPEFRANGSHYLWTNLNIFPHLGRATVCQKKVQLHSVVILWGQGTVHHSSLLHPTWTALLNNLVAYVVKWWFNIWIMVYILYISTYIHSDGCCSSLWSLCPDWAVWKQLCDAADWITLRPVFYTCVQSPLGNI